MRCHEKDLKKKKRLIGAGLSFFLKGHISPTHVLERKMLQDIP